MVLGAWKLGIQLDEDPRRNALILMDDAEQDVLGPNSRAP